MEKSSQIAWKIVPLRHFFPLKVVPLIEVLLYTAFESHTSSLLRGTDTPNTTTLPPTWVQPVANLAEASCRRKGGFTGSNPSPTQSRLWKWLLKQHDLREISLDSPKPLV
jgi:hypothetical protein